MKGDKGSLYHWLILNQNFMVKKIPNNTQTPGPTVSPDISVSLLGKISGSDLGSF